MAAQSYTFLPTCLAAILLATDTITDTIHKREHKKPLACPIEIESRTIEIADMASSTGEAIDNKVTVLLALYK